MLCHFHLTNGHDDILDDEGLEVTDLDDARSQALQAIRDVIQEGGTGNLDWSGWDLSVVDRSGRALFSIQLGQLLR